MINKQRETIYAERDKVLRNEDLTETVQAFLDEEIDALVDDAPRRATIADEWNMDGARRPRSTAMGLDGAGTTRRRALGARRPRGDRRAPRASSPTSGSRPGAREVGEADWSMVERLVLLRTIDSLWVEHLTELDDMRRGIGLRGYAQQDPLNEFRREAFGCTRSCAASSATASPSRSSA